MKKFLAFLIFMILIAGTVLYFGWIRIPENSYGIFFSTITGYDKNVLETGNFYFRWQKLIPKNSETYIISNSTRKRDIVVNDVLPSGDLYSQILQGRPDFSYSISIAVTYSLNKDSVMNYVITNGGAAISEGADNFFIEADKKIQSLIKNYIDVIFSANIESAQNIANQINTSSYIDIFSPEVLKTIASDVDGIEISDLVVIGKRFPDINLYKIAVRQYKEISEDRKKFLLETELKSAAKDAELAKRFEILKKYGALLNEHPILLEYLKINPDGDIFR
jgi:hypothetical protein